MPRSSTKLPIKEKPKAQVPHIFGRGMRDRLLMTLAVNRRPLYVAELAELLGSDDRKIRNTLSVLIDCGIVVRDKHSKSGRYVALNRKFPAYRELLVFLRKLETKYPQRRLGKPRRRAERIVLRDLELAWNKGPFDSKTLDSIFYSKIRTRTLLAISAAPTDVTDIARTFSEDDRSVWNAVNHWQREGIVRSIVIGRRRVLELDPDYQASSEIKAVLRALRRIGKDYDRLATLNTRRIGSPRFVTQR